MFVDAIIFIKILQSNFVNFIFDQHPFVGENIRMINFIYCLNLVMQIF